LINQRAMANTVKNLEIVEDCPARADAIATMTIEAFAREYGTGDAEAALISALRADGDVIAELVALDDGELVGHILFSRVADEPHTGKIVALAPMCARVGRQKMGIGSALIRAGLERCRLLGMKAVIVLGNTEYYGRFGFSVSLAEPIACAYAGEHFQALELEPGGLQGVLRVSYAPAFSATGV
jgi:putative acetyltransferase